jgi:flotillin
MKNLVFTGFFLHIKNYSLHCICNILRLKGEIMLQIILPFVLVLLAAIILLGILASGYVKAPPDRAFIISGLKKEPKILIGCAGIKIPFLERLDKLYLGQMTVDIKTEQSVPTNDFINVNVDAVAKVRIEPTEEGIKLAAKNFLNKNQDQITLDLQDSLQGNMREIIGTLTLKEINTDRDSFSDQVMEKASKDMRKLGIEIVSCNIQNISDENGLIKDLGADNTARIKKDASIAKAQAERDIAIAQAEADKASNDARVLAQTEISQKNNELEIKKAELKKESDTKRAEADAAYEIQNQEQQKTIQTATVNAQIAKTEREAELKNKEVAVMQQTLEAEINKKADAERYAVEQKASADLARRQREAEAKKYEQEKEAEARKAQAEAEKYAMLQEAEGIKAKGEAEAAAIQAKGIAEAEAMEKKADAMTKYGQAAMMEMIVKALPEMAKAIAEPLATIDKVTIIDSGNGDAGVPSMGGYVPAVLAKTIEAVKETTGLDITEIMKANTYDAKVTRNVNITGIPDGTDINDPAKAVTIANISKEIAESADKE